LLTSHGAAGREVHVDGSAAPRSVPLLTSPTLSACVYQLLQTLDDADRRDFIRRARRHRFRSGERVFWQGDAGGSLHLVVKGSFAATVSTASSQSVIVAVFRRDDVFGELALLGEEPARTATIVALESGETLSLTTAQFEEWRERGPHIDRLIIRALALRLREMTTQMLESLHVPIDVRVARRIQLLALALGPYATDGWLRMRQEELADYCGVTRPTVNRVLRKLVNDGVLELGRARFRVLDAAQLEKRANSS